MAARLLKAGGAEAFVPIPATWIYVDADTMQRYSLDLIREVTALNVKADAVDQTIQTFASPGRPMSKLEATNPHATRVAFAQDAIARLPAATRESMRTLRTALEACKTPPNDYESAMRQMKALVGGLHEHVNGPFGSAINVALGAAYTLYSEIRDAAHEDSELLVKQKQPT